MLGWRRLEKFRSVDLEGGLGVRGGRVKGALPDRGVLGQPASSAISCHREFTSASVNAMVGEKRTVSPHASRAMGN